MNSINVNKEYHEFFTSIVLFQYNIKCNTPEITLHAEHREHQKKESEIQG